MRLSVTQQIQDNKLMPCYILNPVNPNVKNEEKNMIEWRQRSYYSKYSNLKK